MRRLFWLGVGLAAGVLIFRKLYEHRSTGDVSAELSELVSAEPSHTGRHAAP